MEIRRGGELVESQALTMRERMWINNILNLIKQVKEMTYEEKQRAFLLASKQFSFFDENEKNQIKAYMRKELGDADSLAVYSFFTAYADGGDFWNEIIDIITAGSFGCYHGTMLEIQVITKLKQDADYYKSLRGMHRKNARRFQDMLEIKIPYIPVEKRNHKRVCILTEQILNTNHAPTRLVLELSFALKLFHQYDVLIVSCPCNLNSDPMDFSYYENYTMTSAQEIYEGKHQIKYRDSFVDMWQISLESRDTEGYCNLMHSIAEWNPLFVFQVGAFNPIAELPAVFTSLVSMKLATGCPVSDAGILVRLNRGTEKEEHLYDDAMNKDQMQFLYEKKMPVLVQESKKRIRRCDLEIPEEGFLMAIVGNRLDQEVDGAFLEIMERIIGQEPRAIFVLIGDKVPEKFLGDSRLDEHVYRVGYQEDLMATYSCLDLYVNPNRHGGGTSAVMALTAGVPVVTLPGGDVAWNVGEDFTVADEGQMEEEILRYIRDKEFYKMKQEIAYEHAKQNNGQELAQYAKGLMDGIIGLLEEQEQRRFAGV